VTNPTPNVNVTPFIDILLVLLIMFMVIAPLKPAAFKTKIPPEQTSRLNLPPHPYALIVSIDSESGIALNNEPKIASLSNSGPLVQRLTKEFELRTANRIYDENLRDRSDLRDDEKILKTVFVKAPREFPYGEVTRLIDLIKVSGATTIGLQLEQLE